MFYSNGFSVKCAPENVVCFQIFQKNSKFCFQIVELLNGVIFSAFKMLLVTLLSVIKTVRMSHIVCNVHIYSLESAVYRI